MFGVTVRDHVMIAHSFRGEVFGPAQRLHGATYVVDATFAAPTSTPTGSWSTSGCATEQLHAVLAELNYRNLDDEEAFAGTNTSTEALARGVADRLAERVQPATSDHAAPGARGDPARVARRVGELRAAAVKTVHFVVPRGIDDPAAQRRQRLRPPVAQELAAQGWASDRARSSLRRGLARAARGRPGWQRRARRRAGRLRGARSPRATRLRSWCSCTCRSATTANARSWRPRRPWSRRATGRARALDEYGVRRPWLAPGVDPAPLATGSARGGRAALRRRGRPREGSGRAARRPGADHPSRLALHARRRRSTSTPTSSTSCGEPAGDRVRLHRPAAPGTDSTRPSPRRPARAPRRGASPTGWP